MKMPALFDLHWPRGHRHWWQWRNWTQHCPRHGGSRGGCRGVRTKRRKESAGARRTAINKFGKIINIGSMYSFFGSGLVPSYSAAKGAIVQLTKSMAIELAPHNIQVNCIAPGWIETAMTVAVDKMPLNDEVLSRTPAGRWGQSDELAGTAVYLASRASDFVTGTTIRVDGGYAIR